MELIIQKVNLKFYKRKKRADIYKYQLFNLFNYSIESFKENGYNIVNITNDLDKENIENIKTEYEEKFTNIGVKINRVEVKKD